MPVQKTVSTGFASAMACVLAVAGLAGCAGGEGGGGTGGKSGRAAASGDGPRWGDARDQTGGRPGASAGRIAKEAVEAMRSVPSLRMKGGVLTGGERLRLNMALKRNGDCTGTIISASEGAAQVRKEGGSDYVKADSTFWKAVVHNGKNAAMAASLLDGRWMRVPRSTASSPQAGDAGADFTSLCDLRAMLAELASPGKPGHATAVTKGRTTHVKGRSVIPLRGKAADGTFTAYVTAKGRPYIVKLDRLDKKRGGRPSSVTFGDFGKPVHVVAPPKGKTVGLGDLFTRVLGAGNTGG